MSKNIQWKKSSIDYTELDKLTSHVINGKLRGNLNKVEGKIGNNIGNYESRSRGQRNSVINQRESGKLDIWRMKGCKAAGIKKKQKTAIEFKEFYDLITLDEFKLNQVSHFARSIDHARKYLNDENFYEFVGFKNKAKVYRKLKQI